MNRRMDMLFNMRARLALRTFQPDPLFFITIQGVVVGERVRNMEDMIFIMLQSMRGMG